MTDRAAAYRFGRDDEGIELIQHLMEHVAEGITCIFNGSTAWTETGFYVQARGEGLTWTVSVIPDDGGIISDALVQLALEEDS